MRIKRKPLTTFSKLSIAFIFLGALPMILVCLIFMRHYENNTKASIQINMEEANYYVTTKINDFIESIDRATEILYDYSTDEYASLYELLEATELDHNEKQLYIGYMLDEVLKTNPAISGAHFITSDGEMFSRFYSQQKSLIEQSQRHHRLPTFYEENPRQLFILPTDDESKWCYGSTDSVLTLARNYMDIRSLNSIADEHLGTLYIDIRTEAIDELLGNINLGRLGNIALVGSHDSVVLYSLRDHDDVFQLIAAVTKNSLYSDNEYFVFSSPVAESENQLVVVFDYQQLFAINKATRSSLVLTLVISVAIIIALSLIFSGRISTPARELKRAMEAVRSGNLDTRTSIRTGDEMEYLGEGFNEMVEQLSDTIQQVYLAQICQRDAELNALKMQIKPHYLYNTLDVIRMSALEQNDTKTARLIESLSKQLRYITDNHSERVTLREELDSLREYSVLIESRYEGRIKMKIEASNDDLDLYLPKLLLQPFVENAIKHGLRDKPQGGTILVEATRQGETLQIMIFNDGLPIELSRLQHIRNFLENSEIGQRDEAGIVSVGMKNTHDRIKLNCGSQYGFALNSDPYTGAVVTIRLPIWKDGESNVENTPC